MLAVAKSLFNTPRKPGTHDTVLLDFTELSQNYLPAMIKQSNPTVTLRLCVMMFLQYAVWGIWLPPLAKYLGTELKFSPAQIGWIMGLAGSAGALAAPFIAGQLADRYFRTERVLASLLAAGAIVQYILSLQTSYFAWLFLSVLYSVMYMPTLALTNSVAFANLSNSEKQFPVIRVWGTIGWIAAAWLFPLFWLLKDIQFQWYPPFYQGTEVEGVTAKLIDSMRISSITALGYACFCLFLPATPPKRNAVEPLAFAKAFGLFKRPSLAVLMLAGLLISTIHQIYFIQAWPFLSARGLMESRIQPAMSIGQFAEIAVLAVLGLLIAKLGFRWVITIGATAYFLRYGIFAMDSLPIEVIVASQALHGFCYACFFAGAYIYVDRMAPDDVRNSAQTVFAIVMLGLGPILSAMLMQGLQAAFKVGDNPMDYSKMWGTLAAIGLVTTVIFAAFFRDESRSGDKVTIAGAEPSISETA